jgi:hypothetical protein
MFDNLWFCQVASQVQRGGRLWSAIQITTAAGVYSVIDIVLADPTQYTGFVAQEQFRLEGIIDNCFVRYYAHGGSNIESAVWVARSKTRHQRVSAGE